MSKGSRQRPHDASKFGSEYDRIFAGTPQVATSAHDAVYGRSVMEDPDLIAEVRQRNRDLNKKLDAMADAARRKVLTGIISLPATKEGS